MAQSGGYTQWEKYTKIQKFTQMAARAIDEKKRGLRKKLTGRGLAGSCAWSGKPSPLTKDRPSGEA